MTLSGVSDCIKEAIGSSSVEQNGNALSFSCEAAKAKVLFNLLGRKIQVELVQDRNGKPADDFRCDLILSIGDSLSD